MFLSGIVAFGNEPVSFDTQWIPVKPEVLTYRSTTESGSGLYQVSINKKDSVFEVYINIISPGFTKTVSGTFNSTMHPLQSFAKIIVDGQIIMDTKCYYSNENLSISTLMRPYNQTMAQSLNFDHRVVDFSQIPLLVRSLQIGIDSQYTFTSLDPTSNTLVPLTLKVTGLGKTQGIDCYKVEVIDFEGQAIYWVEKDARHRVIRVEQLAENRTVDLIQ